MIQNVYIIQSVKILKLLSINNSTQFHMNPILPVLMIQQINYFHLT
jgi:hypothetical protein